MKFSKRSILFSSAVVLGGGFAISNYWFGVGHDVPPPSMEIQRDGAILTVTSADDREFDVLGVSINHSTKSDCIFPTRKNSTTEYNRSILGEISLSDEDTLDREKKFLRHRYI